MQSISSLILEIFDDGEAFYSELLELTENNLYFGQFGISGKESWMPDLAYNIKRRQHMEPGVKVLPLDSFLKTVSPPSPLATRPSKNPGVIIFMFSSVEQDLSILRQYYEELTRSAEIENAELVHISKPFTTKLHLPLEIGPDDGERSLGLLNISIDPFLAKYKKEEIEQIHSKYPLWKVAQGTLFYK